MVRRANVKYNMEYCNFIIDNNEKCQNQYPMQQFLFFINVNEDNFVIFKDGERKTCIFFWVRQL